MKKRLVSCIALVLAMTMLLGGCSSSKTSSDEKAEPAATTNKEAENKTATSGGASEASTGEREKLSIWMREYDGLDLNNCMMTDTLEEMFNVDLEFITFSSAEDTNTQFNLSIASGEYPDIYMSIWLSPQQVASCAENEIFIPLNDYITDGTNYKQALADNSGWENMLTANDGNIYTFFYNDTGVHKASEYKMWYRTEWLQNIGWDAPPTTPKEFKEFLIAIRDKDANGNGDTTDEIPLMGYYAGRQTDPICFLMNPFELYTNKYYYITDDNQIHFSAVTDEWREGLAYIADLYSEGLIAEETYVQDGSTFKAILNKTGEEAQVGVFPAWYNGAEIDTGVMSWFTYEPIAPLKGNKQQSAARFGGNLNLLGAITSSCNNPELAFKLMDYLIGDEGSQMGMYGFEGVTYDYVDQESYSGESKSVSQKVDSLVSYIWNSGYFPRYDKESRRYSVTKNEDLMETDNTYVLLHAAETYEPYYVNHNIPDIVWCSDEEVSQEISDYSSLIGTYIASMDTQFIMGALDINDDAVWQAYLDELNNMGLQDYIGKLYTYYGLK